MARTILLTFTLSLAACSGDLDAPYTTNPRGDPRYPGTRHTHSADVSYGPFERNVLDFWQVRSRTPAPVAVDIHGGGFVNNDKEQVHRNGAIAELFATGVFVASISYRYAYQEPDAALLAPIPTAKARFTTTPTGNPRTTGCAGRSCSTSTPSSRSVGSRTRPSGCFRPASPIRRVRARAAI